MSIRNVSAISLTLREEEQGEVWGETWLQGGMGSQGSGVGESKTVTLKKGVVLPVVPHFLTSLF
jgi:hypothetical protein